MGGGAIGNALQLTDERKKDYREAILKDPVAWIGHGDSRINIVYAKYLQLTFEELSAKTELSPVEKAIILFVQATTANTLEEIEGYQTHILSLLNGTLDNTTFNKIYDILIMTYQVYMVKLQKTEPNKPEPEMLEMLNLAKIKVLQNPIVKEKIENSGLESFAKWTPSV